MAEEAFEIETEWTVAAVTEDADGTVSIPRGAAFYFAIADEENPPRLNYQDYQFHDGIADFSIVVPANRWLWVATRSRPVVTVIDKPVHLGGFAGDLNSVRLLAEMTAAAIAAKADFAEAVEMASTAPLIVNRISALINGVLTEWVREDDGPCLGGGWIPAGDVMPQHFTWAGGHSAAIRAAMLYASQVGARMFIPRGTYTITESAGVVLEGSLIIEFESGAKLVAAPGLSATVLYPKGASGNQDDPGPYDLTVINAQIDCSAGTSPAGTGGGFCTALSFNYFRNVRISGGYLYGGEIPNNNNADSGLTWVTCANVVIDGVRIRGFNDCGIYPGGNNTIGAAGDGGACRVSNCLIQLCQSAMSAKREMDLMVFEGNVVEACPSGVSSQNVAGTLNVPGARRLEVINNTFRKCRANVIRPRGITKGVAKGNQIIDWGYDPDGTNSAGVYAVAVNLDGTKGFDVIGNTFVLDEWAADNQLAILFSEHTLDGTVYGHGRCFGSGNTYRGCPRVYAFDVPGGPHTFLDEYFENVGSTPIVGSNMNSATVITYRSDAEPLMLASIGTVPFVIGKPRVVALTASATLSADKSGTTYTNVGAAAAITLTLPAAIEGRRYRFVQLSNAQVTIQAVGNDFIRLPGNVASAAAGSITSAGRGDFIELEAIGDVNWVCVAHGGAWTAA